MTRCDQTATLDDGRVLCVTQTQRGDGPYRAWRFSVRVDGKTVGSIMRWHSGKYQTLKAAYPARGSTDLLRLARYVATGR